MQFITNRRAQKAYLKIAEPAAQKLSDAIDNYRRQPASGDAVWKAHQEDLQRELQELRVEVEEARKLGEAAENAVLENAKGKCIFRRF